MHGYRVVLVWVALWRSRSASGRASPLSRRGEPGLSLRGLLRHDLL